MALSAAQLRNRIQAFLDQRGVSFAFTVSARPDGQSFGIKVDSSSLSDEEKACLNSLPALFNEWADRDNQVYNFIAYGDAPRKVRLERAGKTDS